MPNQISRTGIEGFDYTWNPVRGCLTGCPYCWARGLTRRFAESMAIAECKYLNIKFDKTTQALCGSTLKNKIECDLRNFKPTWLESQFAKSFPKKPARIVVGWQSDICYWQPEWMERVLGKIREYPQHTFFFLTKKPEVYRQPCFFNNCENLWYGTTVTNQETFNNFIEKGAHARINGNPFLSIEPILGSIKLVKPCAKWIIIGAQTGRGEKVIPKAEWVTKMIYQSKEFGGAPLIYLKDNLLKACPSLLTEIYKLHDYAGQYFYFPGEIPKDIPK